MKKSSDHSKEIKEYDAQEEKLIKFCQHCKYSTIRSSINDAKCSICQRQY